MGSLWGIFFRHVDGNEELKLDEDSLLLSLEKEATGVDRRGLRTVALIAPRDVHG